MYVTQLDRQVDSCRAVGIDGYKSKMARIYQTANIPLKSSQTVVSDLRNLATYVLYIIDVEK